MVHFTDHLVVADLRVFDEELIRVERRAAQFFDLSAVIRSRSRSVKNNDMPSPVSLAAPGTVAAGAAARGRPIAAESTTLRSLMRTNMLPRKQYIG